MNPGMVLTHTIRVFFRHLMSSRSAAIRAEAAKFVMENRFPLDRGSELPIEVMCEESYLQELLRRVQNVWERLGKEEPYWSVCTADSFKMSNFHQYEEEFWKSGEGAVRRMKEWASRNGIEYQPEWVCLEYGCGTGRTTRWLCNDFKSVIACDISGSHLALARGALDRFGCKNVELVQVSSTGLLEDRPMIDALFSMLVLQHNPPPLMAYTLDYLLGKLRRGGIAFFQIPTFDPSYSFSARAYLDAVKHPEIEMHVLPQRYVFRIAAKRDCEIVEVQPDNWTGTLAAISTTFLLRKRIAPLGSDALTGL